jgi:hypothetical protein
VFTATARRSYSGAGSAARPYRLSSRERLKAGSSVLQFGGFVWPETGSG